jgi:hypothetical protein
MVRSLKSAQAPKSLFAFAEFKGKNIMAMKRKPPREDGDEGLGGHSPAIWLYPSKPEDIIVDLKFEGKGFMTLSIPSYNQGWRVYADATGPFPMVTGTYVDDGVFTYLDYDGFRDGNFQQTVGWCIKKEDLLNWQRTKLQELGYAQNEIDDVNYSYGRLLLGREYPQKYFAIFPQHDEIVNASVSLHIEPKPDVIHRMWLYFVPTDHHLKLNEPTLKPISRTGFTVIELGFLTDAEISKDAETPKQGEPSARVSAALVHPAKMLTSPRYSPRK